jgi:hypothetical protein
MQEANFLSKYRYYLSFIAKAATIIYFFSVQLRQIVRFSFSECPITSNRAHFHSFIENKNEDEDKQKMYIDFCSKVDFPLYQPPKQFSLGFPRKQIFAYLPIAYI